MPVCTRPARAARSRVLLADHRIRRGARRQVEISEERPAANTCSICPSIRARRRTFARRTRQRSTGSSSSTSSGMRACCRCRNRHDISHADHRRRAVRGAHRVRPTGTTTADEHDCRTVREARARRRPARRRLRRCVLRPGGMEDGGRAAQSCRCARSTRPPSGCIADIPPLSDADRRRRAARPAPRY